MLLSVCCKLLILQMASLKKYILSLYLQLKMFAMLFLLEIHWKSHEKCSSLLPREQVTDTSMDHLGPSPILPTMGVGRDSWGPTVTFSL